jgi:uncharacterized membrane protein
VADGPLEYIVIGFEGNHFTGEVGAALQDVVEKGIIRVIDIVFAHRDENGTLTVLELQDLEEEEAQVFNPIVTDVTSLFSDDDVREIAEEIEPNSSAALMLFEHVWAEGLRDALVRANGRLLAGGLIPRDTADAAMRAASEAAA